MSEFHRKILNNFYKLRKIKSNATSQKIKALTLFLNCKVTHSSLDLTFKEKLAELEEVYLVEMGQI